MKNSKKPTELPLFSICIPVLNELENLDPLYQRLCALSEKMCKKSNFEFIFTDNNSTDGTWEKLEIIGLSDSRVRAYRFARNIGFQNSILYNLSQSRGEAVAQIDADLQDPPELLEDFFDLWSLGIPVVYGIRESREESSSMNLFRKLGYMFIDRISDYPITRNAGDFRLLDRSVVDLLKSIKTPDPYLRGIIASLGLREVGIPYARSGRRRGESKFGIISLMRLGTSGIINHSNLPTRLITYVGISSLFLSFFGMLYYISMKIIHPEFLAGFASIYVLVLFGIGINSLILSILSGYIRNIYQILCAEPTIVKTAQINS